MNSVLKSSLSLLLILMLFNCDNVENLADIDFPVTLVKTLPVVAPTTNEMTMVVTLEATTDPEIQKYVANIKSYEITELLFRIENYFATTEDEIYFTGSIGFSKTSDNQATSSCPVSNIPITHWAGTADFPISTCDDILNEISMLFTDENAVKIYMIGTFTKAPVSFDLQVTVKAKITANPL